MAPLNGKRKANAQILEVGAAAISLQPVIGIGVAGRVSRKKNPVDVAGAHVVINRVLDGTSQGNSGSTINGSTIVDDLIEEGAKQINSVADILRNGVVADN